MTESKWGQGFDAGFLAALAIVKGYDGLSTMYEELVKGYGNIDSLIAAAKRDGQSQEHADLLAVRAARKRSVVRSDCTCPKSGHGHAAWCEKRPSSQSAVEKSSTLTTP